MTLPIAGGLMEEGVRVNTILPGIFDTPLLQSLPQRCESLARPVGAVPETFGPTRRIRGTGRPPDHQRLFQRSAHASRRRPADGAAVILVRTMSVPLTREKYHVVLVVPTPAFMAEEGVAISRLAVARFLDDHAHAVDIQRCATTAWLIGSCGMRQAAPGCDRTGLQGRAGAAHLRLHQRDHEAADCADALKIRTCWEGKQKRWRRRLLRRQPVDRLMVSA